jgi:hypothetical protein
LQAVFDEIRDHLCLLAASSWLWCGRRVKVLDGTNFSMPDTKENQKQWPQSRTEKMGFGFLVAKMLVVFCLSIGG